MRFALNPRWRPWALGALAGLAATQPAAAQQIDPGPDRDRLVAEMVQWTDLPERRIVAFTPEMGVIILDRGSPAKTPGRVDGVEVQGEVIDEALAQDRGWRSIRTRVDIACDERKTQVRKVDVFAQHNLLGAAYNVPAPSGWMRPAQGAYLSAVVDAVCGGEPTAEPIRLTEQDKPPAPPVPAMAAAPSAAPSPSAAAPPSPPPAGAGLVTVQVNASPDAAGASAALAALMRIHTLSLGGLNLHVEPAQVAGRQVYRALVTGLATRAAGRAFCADVSKAGGACFVRPD
jgi:hypothetical protein